MPPKMLMAKTTIRMVNIFNEKVLDGENYDQDDASQGVKDEDQDRQCLQGV